MGRAAALRCDIEIGARRPDPSFHMAAELLGGSDAAAIDGAAERAAAELEVFVIEDASESANGSSRSALSLDPAGSNPSRPASHCQCATAFITPLDPRMR